MAAKQQGIDLETYRNRKKMREEMTSIQMPESTGNPMDDMGLKLDEIAKIAAKYGDSDTLLKINQKRVALKAQRAELRKMDAESGRTEEQTYSFMRDNATGIRIRDAGQPPEGIGSEARFISDPSDPNFEKWEVTHPNGQIEYRDAVTPVNEELLARASNHRLRQFETAQANAIQQAGGSSKFRGNRDLLTNMAEMSKDAGTAADILAAGIDPQARIGALGATQRLLDQGIRFIESSADLLWGTGEHTWDGKKVSRQQQETSFVKGFVDRMLGRDPSEAGVPAGLVGQMRENTAAYEQWLAITGKMYYMDARSMEPANRGLSDSDIERAMERVGSDSQNPMTFINRQRANIQRDLARLSILGHEFTPVPELGITKQQIIDAQYSPEQIALVRQTLQDSLVSLNESEATIMAKFGRNPDGTPQAAPSDARGQAVKALMDTGMTEEEAEAYLDE